LLALRLSLKWGQDPQWFYNLDADTKSSIIAEHNISLMTPDKIKERKKQATRKRLRR